MICIYIYIYLVQLCRTLWFLVIKEEHRRVTNDQNCAFSTVSYEYKHEYIYIYMYTYMYT